MSTYSYARSIRGAVLAAFFILLTPVRGQTLKTLYAFAGAPTSGVVIGAGGVLYGTTIPTSSGGEIYSLSPPSTAGGAWTYTTLYTFPYDSGCTAPSSDGCDPMGVILGGGGVLYGTTYEGGTANAGTVFSLTPPASSGGSWTETVLYSFGANSSDGVHPQVAPTIGPGGVLYGTTSGGGANGNWGTVYALVPPASAGGQWRELILHSFNNNGDGNLPTSALAIGSGGVLYGTTFSGGRNDGTVFSVTPPTFRGGQWTERVLYAFGTLPTDGSLPIGGVVIGSGGVLYGTTRGVSFKGGNVYSLTPPTTANGVWTETVLYTFGQSANDGNLPFGGVGIARGGILIGTTAAGGTPSPTCAAGCGTIFALKPPATPGGTWTESILHSFSGSDGADPQYPLTILDGVLVLGTTTIGTGGVNGTVFAFIP